MKTINKVRSRLCMSLYINVFDSISLMYHHSVISQTDSESCLFCFGYSSFLRTQHYHHRHTVTMATMMLLLREALLPWMLYHSNHSNQFIHNYTVMWWSVCILMIYQMYILYISNICLKNSQIYSQTHSMVTEVTHDT